MVYVNDAACDGCGECVDVCPTGALIFQNNRAFIDQELCQGCDACIDACPQAAILSGDRIPAHPEIVCVTEVVPQQSPMPEDGSNNSTLHEKVLPVVGSLLIWTGRELVPRLANAVLGYLDQRTQFASSQKNGQQGGNGQARPERGYGRGHRRQRQRRNYNHKRSV